ncbi:MAG TPA: AAA family ATPase, partial [Actinomycetes bacterium]|nr:AAA family ATPase [Actinomycetes bacterium]
MHLPSGPDVTRAGLGAVYRVFVDLVGRLRELRALEELLERAVDGSGGLVVLTGPGGSGRSALAEATGALARG